MERFGIDSKSMAYILSSLHPRMAVKIREYNKEIHAHDSSYMELNTR